MVVVPFFEVDALSLPVQNPVFIRVHPALGAIKPQNDHVSVLVIPRIPWVAVVGDGAGALEKMEQLLQNISTPSRRRVRAASLDKIAVGGYSALDMFAEDDDFDAEAHAEFLREQDEQELQREREYERYRNPQEFDEDDYDYGNPPEGPSASWSPSDDNAAHDIMLDDAGDDVDQSVVYADDIAIEQYLDDVKTLLETK